jgi:hypothetical protein
MTKTTQLLIFLAMATLCEAASAEPVTAFLAAYGSMIATAATVVGTAYSAYSYNQAGKQADAQAKSQAQQLEQQAGQRRAMAQRQSLEDRRQARLASSRVQALAGGGGGDESILGLTGEIAGEGEYNALTSMYEGSERAAGSEFAATNARAEGAAAKSAYSSKAISSVLQGGSSLYGKYGNGGVGAMDGDGLSQGDRRKIGVY